MKKVFLFLSLMLFLMQGVSAQVLTGSYLGVFLADLDEARAKNLKSFEIRGAIVGKVIKDSPADKAGLLENDIIISFDNQPVVSAVSVYTFLSEALPGSSVLLRFIRNGAEQDVTVVVTERQNGSDRNDVTNQNQYTTVRRAASLGIAGTELTNQLAIFFGVAVKSGLLITEVGLRSPAMRAGLKAGDCIVTVNEQSVSTLDAMNQLYSEFSLKRTMNGKPIEELSLKIIREQKEMMLVIKVEQFKD